MLIGCLLIPVSIVVLFWNEGRAIKTAGGLDEGAGFVRLLDTAAIAPLVIAIGWLWYRPIVSIAIIVVGGAATYGLLRLMRRRTARTAIA